MKLNENLTTTEKVLWAVVNNPGKVLAGMCLTITAIAGILTLNQYGLLHQAWSQTAHFYNYSAKSLQSTPWQVRVPIAVGVGLIALTVGVGEAIAYCSAKKESKEPQNENR